MSSHRSVMLVFRYLCLYCTSPLSAPQPISMYSKRKKERETLQEKHQHKHPFQSRNGGTEAACRRELHMTVFGCGFPPTPSHPPHIFHILSGFDMLMKLAPFPHGGLMLLFPSAFFLSYTLHALHHSLTHSLHKGW